MASLKKMVTWNRGLMRDLAESVLKRAKTIRGRLKPNAKMAAVGTTKKATVKKNISTKKVLRKATPPKTTKRKATRSKSKTNG